jgi:hypothetical protein
MSEVVTQPTMQEHNHKGLYTTIFLSLGAAAILLVVVLAMMTKHPTMTQPQEQTMQYQPTQTAEEQIQQSVQHQIQQVTPQPITTKQNLDSAVQTLDSTDITQISTGLNQNSQDISSFAQ